MQTQTPHIKKFRGAGTYSHGSPRNFQQHKLFRQIGGNSLSGQKTNYNLVGILQKELQAIKRTLSIPMLSECERTRSKILYEKTLRKLRAVSNA
jgi:DNA-binding transcriptional regulator LsrR (DeoR family)